MDFTGLIFGLPPDTVTVTCPLTSVGLGRSEDIPPEGLEGKVAWFQPEDDILADNQSLRALQENVAECRIPFARYVGMSRCACSNTPYGWTLREIEKDPSSAKLSASCLGITLRPMVLAFFADAGCRIQAGMRRLHPN